LGKRGKILVGKMEQRGHLEDLGVDGRIKSKLKKWNGRGCTEVTWLGKGASGRLL